ncbi:hypothetical protein [Microbacterium halophytorum]|uniref:hypothetical protein n=1 Tax=Microbacterium halophytorum TaxID=2067568 RepID=UPI000CFB79D7|nr:hypothetical protein [Microbacterium halophytorum]
MAETKTSEENWVPARLIPTSGISGAEEQETRATSALLAVMLSVDEFGRTLTKLAGAPAGKIETFTEVIFKVNGTKTTVRPDGLIRVTRGARMWTALVEVKTGKNELVAEQLNAYADVAREHGFDALITVSNQISPNADKHPTPGIDGRKLRKVALHHWSWSRVLSIAVMEREHKGINDPDQAWILGELIRYLEHPKSGALSFDDMGSEWVRVRDAVTSGTLRASDREAFAEVTANFDALLRYSSLHLGKRLGTDVRHQMSRKEQIDPAYRQQVLERSLLGTGVLSGTIRIPDTVGDIAIEADLRSKTVTCHIEIDAPKLGRNRTRVNWLTRQLKAAPGALRVEAAVPHQRGRGAAELLDTVRGEPDSLITEKGKEIVRFRVAATTPMGTKRGTGKNSFIDSVLDAVDGFYADVVQHLKAWQAPPPKSPRAPVMDDAVDAALSEPGSAESMG